MVKRYFDVNVFVYFLTESPSFSAKARKWIEETDEIYTAEITYYQLIIILSKLTNNTPEEVLPQIASFFEDLGVKFLHLEPHELKKVSEISKGYNLDFEDSIHFYLSGKVGELISNDKDLKKLGAKF
ncbi:type II toxin-antitoxin system VapC family toxin [Acidianus sp. RZ1]|uniref:type II toxin-antitoxin system VapC family toxin n=1 Tax=Acidianus sp. RZ1 TaxID=1540082 RepID=UPI0014915D84|nr:type II toxin-antitoxin system VapC family toxin [Acidianus sp. RZ1]NON62083.1 type II toxin-antitoxin system VapC family toxin [Acidianus sp. RZ1]